MKLLSFLPVILLFSACQSKQSVLFSPTQYQYPVATQRRQVEEAGPGNAAPFVRQSEVVKVYGMNRYVDPGDPRIMHERHAIYRLEQQPAWATRAPRNRNEIILGPIVGLQKPEYAPEPLPGETVRELAEARRSTQQMSQDISTMRDGQAELANSVKTLAKETAEAQRKLTSVVSVLNERVGHLEGGKDNSREEQSAASAADGEVVIHTPNQ